MTNLFNAHIESMSIHRVGNKSRNEKPFYSQSPYKPSDEIIPLLKEFFLKPFRDKEENFYQFSHDVDIAYNKVFSLSKAIFNDGIYNDDVFHYTSVEANKHLFEASNHPHIKNGDVFVVRFSGVSLNNTVCDAIGIYKAEILSDFIQVVERNAGEQNLKINLNQGISLDKLDKGALIFNVDEENGYKVLCVDQNKYDARYWLEHFLGVDASHDENYITKKYIKFVEDFGKDVVFPAEDKKEQVMFSNRSLNYFAKNDAFNENDFLNEVLDNPDLVAEYHSYKAEKGEKYSIEDITEFDISNQAVSDARKKIKNVIELDTNITIKLDFVNPESVENFVEKGWDEEKQMYYYLLYYNKESK